MLKTELLEIIANGENSGVEDNGAVSGLQRPDTEEWVMNVEKMIAGLRYSRNTVTHGNYAGLRVCGSSRDGDQKQGSAPAERAELPRTEL